MNHDPNHKYGNSLSHTTQGVLSSVTTLRPSPHGSGVFRTLLTLFCLAVITMCPPYEKPIKSKAILWHSEVFIYYIELLTVIYEDKTTCRIQCDAVNHNRIQNKCTALERPPSIANKSYYSCYWRSLSSVDLAGKNVFSFSLLAWQDRSPTESWDHL